MRNLDELLSALQLGTDIRLMGLSFGGWEAAEYALAHPERLARVALIAPAGTLFNLPPASRGVGCCSCYPFVASWKSMLRWSLPHLGTATDAAGRRTFESLVDEGYLGTRSFDLRQGAIPRVLSDGQLASIGRRRSSWWARTRRSPARDAIGVWLASRRGVRTSSFEGRDTT